MASEVKRWDWDTACGCMLASDDGAYVESSDFDAQAAELANLRAELDTLRSCVRTDNSAVIAALQDQLAEARVLLMEIRRSPEKRCVAFRCDIDAWLERNKG